MANTAAASVEYSRATCSASMQHVSEQKENKVSWLDQLGSWWDKNSTAITTGVMAIAIGTVAVMTVVATGGLAAPALAAAFAGALGTTYGALAASFVVSGIAAAGVTAATTGVVSLASTVPGLSQALSPTVNSTSFQMLQSGSMIIAGTGAAFLAQFAPTSNNKTQTQKEEAQAEAKAGEQTSTAGNTAGEGKTQTPVVEGVASEGGTKILDSVDASKQIINAERVGSALKNDIYHRAASFVPESQLASGETFSIIGGDGVQRTLLQVCGEVNGETGIFEYLLDPNGTITHQLFKPGGIIDGKING